MVSAATAGSAKPRQVAASRGILPPVFIPFRICRLSSVVVDPGKTSGRSGARVGNDLAVLAAPRDRHRLARCWRCHCGPVGHLHDEPAAPGGGEMQPPMIAAVDDLVDGARQAVLAV